MLELIKSLFSAIAGLFSFLQQNQLVKAGEDKVVAKQATKETEIVIKADEVRAQAKAIAATVPVSDSLPDDGFRRD